MSTIRPNYDVLIRRFSEGVNKKIHHQRKCTGWSEHKGQHKADDYLPQSVRLGRDQVRSLQAATAKLVLACRKVKTRDSAFQTIDTKDETPLGRQIPTGFQ